MTIDSIGLVVLGLDSFFLKQCFEPRKDVTHNLYIVLLDNINYTLKVQGGHYFSRDLLFINTFQGQKEHGRLALIKSRKNGPHE